MNVKVLAKRNVPIVMEMVLRIALGAMVLGNVNVQIAMAMEQHINMILIAKTSDL